jgi:hypothetical protein
MPLLQSLDSSHYDGFSTDILMLLCGLHHFGILLNLLRCHHPFLMVILGDLNAKIGKGNEYRGKIGTESLHDMTNNNGMKLIDFAESKNMIVSSTYFPHKDLHKRT